MAPRREAPQNPAPVAADGPTTIVVTPPAGDDEGDDETSEEIGRIAGRVDAIETRIGELQEGNETWRQTTITSLQQEIADLRATLQTVTENQPAALTELRGELTRLSQELAQMRAVPPPSLETETVTEVVTPPETPPEHPDEREDGQRGSHADSVPLNQPPAPGQPKRKRVL